MNDATPLIVGLEQAAIAMNVSLPTIRKWLPDIKRSWPDGGASCPVRMWGGNGKSYEVDINLLKNWRADIERQATEERRRKEDALTAQQASMDLEGGEAKGISLLPLEIRKKAAETVMAEHKAGVQRGDLLRRDEVTAEFEKVLTFLSTNLRDLGNRLERRCNLDATTVTVIEEETLSWQAQIARMLQSDGYLDDGKTGIDRGTLSS